MWTSDTAEGTVGLKLGSRYFYTLYSFGTEALGTDDRLYAGLGIGGHIPAGPAFVDIELIGQAIIEDRKWPDKVHMLNQGRIGLGLRVLPFMSVIAGGTVNVYVSELNDGAGIVPAETWHSSAKPDDNPTWVDVWPGFYLGIQL